MIRLTDILNEDSKSDFVKAISGKKPAEVYRVHAETDKGKVGITAWYTKATINDVVKDIKRAGFKILKIEKSTKEADLKEAKEVIDENIIVKFLDIIQWVTEKSAILINMVIGIIVGGIIRGLSNIAYKVKLIVAPSDWQKLAKELDRNKQFSKEVFKVISDKGGLSGVKSWYGLSFEIIKLPSFKKIFADFVKENNITKGDADYLLKLMRDVIADTLEESGEQLIKRIKKQNPDLK